MTHRPTSFSNAHPSIPRSRRPATGSGDRSRCYRCQPPRAPGPCWPGTLCRGAAASAARASRLLSHVKSSTFCPQRRPSWRCRRPDDVDDRHVHGGTARENPGRTRAIRSLRLHSIGALKYTTRLDDSSAGSSAAHVDLAKRHGRDNTGLCAKADLIAPFGVPLAARLLRHDDSSRLTPWTRLLVGNEGRELLQRGTGVLTCMRRLDAYNRSAQR